MRLLFRLCRLLFTLYAFVVFVATLLLAVSCYVVVFTLFPSQRAPHIAHGISRIWARVLLGMYLVRFRLSGPRPEPGRTYVFVANHRSMIDIPAYAVSCRNTFRFLAKAELTRIPLMGYVIRKLYVSVNRADRADRSRSMEAMKKSLAEGVSVFICPEGTRNTTARPLLDFRDGAFRLAILTGTPLVILVLQGTAKILDPKRPAELWPGVIRGTWCGPLETAGMTEADLPALKQRTYGIMQAVLAGGRPAEVENVV